MGLQRGFTLVAGVALGLALTFSAAHAEDDTDGYCQTHAADSVAGVFGGLAHLCAWSVGLSDSPEAQPAPAPAPPPPPPPPEPKVFVVFFAFGDMDLNNPAKETVSAAVQTAKTGGFAKVHIIGNTDTAEDDAYVLSLARAQTVRDQMQVNGLADASFETEGKAATALKIPTPAGTKESLNRRVLIELEK